MYPSLFIWWNPVFHFPLSGAVNQDFVQQVNNQMRTVMSTVSEIANHLPETERDQSPKLKEHLCELHTQLDMLNRTIRQQ
jgi:hypothetical protein